MHSGMIDTAVTCIAVAMTPLWNYDNFVTLDLIFEWLWLPLKGISIKNTYLQLLVNLKHKNLCKPSKGVNR
jgi:hypothetical protein